MDKANERLENLFGVIDDDTDDDLQILNRMIEAELTFENSKVVYK